MAYDEGLAQRVEDLLSDKEGVEDKKMFGGVGFLVNGNMACGVYKDHLIVRLGVDDDQKANSEPNTKAFDITGRPMKGWVMVELEGYAEDDDLEKWVRWGYSYAKSLKKK